MNEHLRHFDQVAEKARGKPDPTAILAERAAFGFVPTREDMEAAVRIFPNAAIAERHLAWFASPSSSIRSQSSSERFEPFTSLAT